MRVESLHEVQREAPLAGERSAARFARQELLEAPIRLARVDPPHDEVEVVPEIVEGSQLAVASVPMVTSDVDRTEVGRTHDLHRLRRGAVQELGAELDGNG
jgi:hypothetical protein